MDRPKDVTGRVPPCLESTMMRMRVLLGPGMAGRRGRRGEGVCEGGRGLGRSCVWVGRGEMLQAGVCVCVFVCVCVCV